MKRSLLVLLPLCGCATGKQVADLATNEAIYRDVAFSTRAPGDRTVFVTPLADSRRSESLPMAQGAYPILYDADGRWQRTPAEMLDEVLRREVVRSGLFGTEVARAAEADVVLVPSLITFATGAMELDMGACALAEVALRLKVFGPLLADGSRELLLDEVFNDRQVTESGLKPPSRFPLAGLAARNAMQRLLQELDGTNVGRSGVPVEAGARGDSVGAAAPGR